MKYIIYIIISVLFLSELTSQNNILQFGHSGWVSTFKVSPDKLTLATGGSNDGQVILWDINLRQVKSKYQTYGNRINNIAFNASNKQIAAIDGQGNIFVWDTETNKLEYQFQPGGYGPIAYNSESETSKYFSPNKSTNTGGGVLLFIENDLYVGMDFPSRGFQSSLFKIDLETKYISAVNNMLKGDYNDYLGIGFLDQIDEQTLVLQFGQFSYKSSVVTYNIKTSKIEKYLIKNKPDIESIALNKDKSKIAITLDENYDYVTYIFDITNGKKIDKIEYGGELTWQGDNLWIGFADQIRNYNTKSKRFQNYFEAIKSSSTNSLKYIDKYKKLLINGGTIVYLIEPLNLKVIASSDNWFDKKSYGKNNIYKNINNAKFLDDKNVLVQYYYYDTKNVDADYEKYIWNTENNNIVEILPHKKKSAIRGINDNVIYGYDLDSTKINEKYFDGTQYTNVDPNTLDFYRFNDNKFKIEQSLDENNIIKINENDETLFVYDRAENIHLINYVTKDTLITVKEKYTNSSKSKVYYDKSSGSIAVYQDNYPNEDTLKFYRITDVTSSPFFEYKSDYLKVLGFDGKKRIITNSESFQERIINIANPEKYTLIDDNFGEIVHFHPTEPWIFYIKKYSSNSIVCYDYNKNIKIGGFTINDDEAYNSGISNFSINAEGDKLLVWLKNSKLFAISISGFTDIKTITEYNQPVNQISDDGKFLSLNSAIINLSNLQVEKKFNKDSYTKIFKTHALNFDTYTNEFKNDEPIYLVTTKYYLKNQSYKTDSINISDVGLHKYYKPMYMADNQYLFLKNTGDRYNPELKILDLKSKKLLLNETEINYKPDFKDDGNNINFYSNFEYYSWKKGSGSLQKKDISSKNLYLFRPESSVVRVGESQLLKSELDALIRYNLKNKISNDTIIIPEAYTRVMLMSKGSDSLVWSSVFSKQTKAFGLTSFNPMTEKWGDFIRLKSRPTKIQMTNAKDFLVIILSTGEIQLRNPKNGNLLANIYQDADSDIITVTKDGYYTSSNPNKTSFLKEIKGEIFYDKLLDFKNNRPDKVLNVIGKATENEINLYKKASELRRQFFNIDDNLTKRDTLPTFKIDYPNQDFVVNKNTAKIKLKDTLKKDLRVSKIINGQVLNDSGYAANDVLNLPISYGENHIQLFTNNSTLGKEVKITSKLKEENENLIICIISVSKYKDSTYNLNYAVKDGKDLTKAFKKQSDAYNSIKSYELYDAEVTKENIQRLISEIQSNPNDKFIFFLSGHGLLDEDNNFYFATHDVDFKNPKNRGMGLIQFQQLLSKLKSQKKLLFIDACYSGLVDSSKVLSEEVLTTEIDNKALIKAQSFNTKGSKASSARSTRATSSKSAFELMQSVFSSFSSSTGLETITAASGNSVALESSRWQNGSFTYAIKLGLLDYKADTNGNGIISVNELKNYILDTVPKLTNGTQKPTTREVNKYLNWDLWY